MPDPENIMGLGGKWHEVRGDLEYSAAPNGCLSCHAETFCTDRHQVNHLRAASIEELARIGTSDTCFGCHGGRARYRISCPYPRTSWPGMDTETVPDWAANRPTASKPEHQLAKPLARRPTDDQDPFPDLGSRLASDANPAGLPAGTA